MATIRTMCPMNCHPTLCGMLVTVEDGRLVEVAGDPENPDSRGFLCVRGHASREVIGNPDRILTPLARAKRGGALATVSWDEALVGSPGACRRWGARRSASGQGTASSPPTTAPA